MARIAGEMVHNVLDAFAARDSEKGRFVCERDRAVDASTTASFAPAYPHDGKPAQHHAGDPSSVHR
jgi:phosphate transport system protein